MVAISEENTVRLLSEFSRENIIAVRGKEIEILEYLWKSKDRVVPRPELLHEVWGYENAEAVDTRTVDIHITKLRKKVEDDPARPKILLTLRGEGYQLRSSVHE